MSEIVPKKIKENVYEIQQKEKNYMKVPARIFANEKIIKAMEHKMFLQATHVAWLPGIYKNALVLPDGHMGYGFPIGGVAATDYNEGVISPGGVGYDINCGVRAVRTNLKKKDILPHSERLAEELFRNVPAGVGSKAKIHLNRSQLNELLTTGAKYCIKNGLGWDEDLEHCEENGQMKNADPSKVSEKAISRGMPQAGSLGSGNHFLEIQYVDQIYDENLAKAMGIIEKDQVIVMIHSGSRGLGHQICGDYLRSVEKAMQKYNLHPPDRELSCVPTRSDEGQAYFGAMACGANFAWGNRQMILHWVRETFEKRFQASAEDLDMHLIYDVAHNIAKKEEHTIDGKRRVVITHRKGATRAFPAEHPEVPQVYRSIGQPVILPGSMGTASYILVGQQNGMELSFGSTAHGAGRVLSRSAALRRFWGSTIKDELKGQGIHVKSTNPKIIAEEAPGVYKDIDAVANVSHSLGIGKKVVRLKPITVVKG
ncbi:MAG TPA: RtcB family protein [candidate division Zixibacteria bacterium]|nr:RtcB family protein [candidate division Zixibacteria bacterium]